MAVVPWNSDGARVIDLSAGAPREVASFVPPDVADPTGVLPAKAYVVSVGLLTLPRKSAGRAREYVVISDVNSGLYVLEAPWTSKPAERLGRETDETGEGLETSGRGIWRSNGILRRASSKQRHSSYFDSNKPCPRSRCTSIYWSHRSPSPMPYSFRLDFSARL